MSYQSINPSDGKLLKSFEHMSSARLDDVLAAADAALAMAEVERRVRERIR